MPASTKRKKKAAKKASRRRRLAKDPAKIRNEDVNKSENQIPHPAKTAGIRDDTFGGARSRNRMSANPPAKQTPLSAGEWFEKLVTMQTRLHAPKSCPWDRE